MEKWMCWGGVSVGGLFLLLFVLDMILGLADMQGYAPFGGLSYAVDVVSAIAAGLLLYISLDALRELR